jgi:hypothetical protein
MPGGKETPGVFPFSGLHSKRADRCHPKVACSHFDSYLFTGYQSRNEIVVSVQSFRFSCFSILRCPLFGQWVQMLNIFGLLVRG